MHEKALRITLSFREKIMRVSKKWAVLSGAAFSAMSGVYAPAAITIDAGPGYVLTSGGYRSSTSSVASVPGISEGSVAGTGIMTASSTYYNATTSGANGAGTATYSNGFIVTPTGPVILSQVPGATSAYTANSINPGATLITGTASVSGQTSGGTVWTPNGTAYVLPTPIQAQSALVAAATTGLSINDLGTVVGGGNVYSSANAQLGPAGYAYFNTGTSTSPVYSANSVSQLLPVAVSTATSNNQSVQVIGIGSDGTTFGSSSSTTTTTTITGRFATIWSTGNTAPGSPATVAGTALTVTPTVALPNLYNTSGTGGASQVNAINGSDVAGGSVALYPSGSSTSVTEPVIWNTKSSSVGTVLAVPAAYTGGTILGVNSGGDGVGNVTASGAQGAVLWKASSSYAPVSLSPVTSPVVDAGSGSGYSIAAANTAGTTAYGVRSVNDADYSVGALFPTSSNSTPLDALLWNANGNVTELNSLVNLTTVASGVAGFVSLVDAYAITNDGWISGLGVYYDPSDTTYNTGNPQPYTAYGAGTYYRTFEIQDTAAVPEPASAVTLLVVAAAGTLRRRRSSRLG